MSENGESGIIAFGKDEEQGIFLPDQFAEVFSFEWFEIGLRSDGVVVWRKKEVADDEI